MSSTEVAANPLAWKMSTAASMISSSRAVRLAFRPVSLGRRPFSVSDPLPTASSRQGDVVEGAVAADGDLGVDRAATAAAVVGVEENRIVDVDLGAVDLRVRPLDRLGQRQCPL